MCGFCIPGPLQPYKAEEPTTTNTTAPFMTPAPARSEDFAKLNPTPLNHRFTERKQAKLRDAALPTISSVIANHRDTGRSVGGFLSECTCSAGVDYWPDHWQEEILKECFPHLAALHASLIGDTTPLIPKHVVLKVDLDEAEDTLDRVRKYCEYRREDNARGAYTEAINNAKLHVLRILDGEDLEL